MFYGSCAQNMLIKWNLLEVADFQNGGYGCFKNEQTVYFYEK